MALAPIQVAFYKSHLDNSPASIVLPWEELVEALSSPTYTDCHPCRGHNCAAKFGEAWSPVDIIGTRANVNVRAVTAAVIDIDNITHAQLVDIAPKLDGLEHIVHSTHSNSPPDHYALRLVMPLSQPVPAAYWQQVLHALIMSLALPIRREDAGGVDPICKDLSRLYFLPSAPVGSTPIVERGHGAILDVPILLQIAAELAAATSITGAPIEAVDQSLENLPGAATSDLGELRKRLAQVRYRKARSTDTIDRERYQILDRILRGQPLAEPGARDNTVNQAAALVAFALPARTPTGAAMEIMRQSIATMATQPEGFDHWMHRAIFSYDRAMLRRLERDAMAEATNTRLRTRLASMGKSPPSAAPMPAAASRIWMPSTPQGPSYAPASAITSLPSALSTPIALPQAQPAKLIKYGDWRDSLLFKGEGLINCGENVFLILANADETRGFFVWDDMKKSLKITGGAFEDTPLEILDVVISDWLQREFGLTANIDLVGKRIERAARVNTFDPLADYLCALPARYDNVKRIDNFLIDHCNAVRTNADGKDITRYLQLVSRYFLISAVARALSPGCQVDTVLILEGPPGFGKTSVLRILGGQWFCGNKITLGDKDSLMLAASNWIIEMSELASWRKADSHSMNAFITQLEDKFRLPYGRVISEAPRRCVLTGTMNPEEGGLFPNVSGIRRRYWPVLIGKKIDQAGKDRIRADRDMIFAEAVIAFVQGAQWHFTDEDQLEADEQVDERIMESTVFAKVIDWWFGMSPAQRPMELRTDLVAEQVLRCTLKEIPRGMQTEIGKAIAEMRTEDGQLAFRKKRPSIGGNRMYVYYPTEMMKNAVQKGALRLVGGTGSSAGSTFGKKKEEP